MANMEFSIQVCRRGSDAGQGGYGRYFDGISSVEVLVIIKFSLQAMFSYNESLHINLTLHTER